MQVYALTKGIYSDYHIIGIFETKERAQKVKKLFTEEIPMYVSDEMYIEEYDTENFSQYLNGYKNYFLRFDKQGNVIEIRDETKKREWKQGFHISFDYNHNITMNLDAKNETSAIKIGSEKRMEFLHKELLKKDIKDSGGASR